ncbi:DUF2059 domain-containing protein [Candidatus Babela massiliensis]|uniref:Uncharacterized conserved protein n=1 Tax=Candidatus Babela massiliensis TaxID=673862 RepID=V6DF48_9BACT|nr:DUF2059 domain-containing protein [Candidatus Babela massiliensis]CDK30222.1 Uncharacterized conserved protein [Candidatus Babela massiliensis]
MKKLLFSVLVAFNLQQANLWSVETDNKKLRNIEKILNLTIKSDQISESFKAMTAQILGSVEQKEDEYSKKLLNLQQDYLNNILEEFKSDKFVSKIAQVYDNIYTEQEVEEILNFYNSPVGKKTIEKMPEVTVATSEAVTDIMRNSLNNFISKVNELQIEYQAK